MSNISTRHNVIPFIAGKSAALAGQKIIKAGYKSTKDKATKKTIPAKYVSVYASVPKITVETITERAADLSEFLIEMLDNAQAGILKSLYESSNGTLSSIADEELDIDSCIAFMAAESEGRMTKVFLETWFDENVSENFTVVLADRLGFDDMNTEQMITINQHLAGYKGMFSALSGGKTTYTEAQVNNLLRVLEVSSVDDAISAKLEKKLNKMLVPKVPAFECLDFFDMCSN